MPNDTHQPSQTEPGLGRHSIEFRLSQYASADQLVEHRDIERWYAIANAGDRNEPGSRRIRVAVASLIWADLTRLDDHVHQLTNYKPMLGDLATSFARAGRLAGSVLFVLALSSHAFWRDEALSGALVWLAAARLRSDTVLVRPGLQHWHPQGADGWFADGFETLSDGMLCSQGDPWLHKAEAIATLGRADRTLASPAGRKWAAERSGTGRQP